MVVDRREDRGTSGGLGMKYPRCLEQLLWGYLRGTSEDGQKSELE